MTTVVGTRPELAPGARPETQATDGLGEGVRSRSSTRGAGFRTDIQGMRAVAVLLVVLYHAGVPLVGGGYVGVDVFFVISGFLITSHLMTEVETTGRLRLLAFWARRIRRLLPPALLVLATTVTVARLWGPLLDTSRTAVDGLWAIGYALNYRLAAQGVDYQEAAADPSPLQHFWSLAVEEQYYLVWPVLLLALALLATRLSPGRRRAAIAVPVLVLCALSLHASVVVTEANPALAYYGLQTRAWELGAGTLLALSLPLLRRTPPLLASAVTWLGLAAVLAAAVAYDDRTPFPGTAALVPVLGAALVLAGGSAAPTRSVDVVLRRRPVQLVGHLSYAWYLWHWPAIVLGPSLFGMDFGVAEKLELSVIALWLAALTHLLVERPVRRPGIAVRRWLMAGAAMSATAALVAVTVVIVAPDVQGDGADVATADVADQAELTRELTAALQPAAVPGNLEPSIPTADQDVPQTSIDGCHVTLLETEQGSCVYGDTDADRTILLFGDSHAEQWFSALDLYGEQEGWRVVSWTKVACPLADVTIDNEQLGRTYTECDTWRDQRMAAVADLAPTVVVASQADGLVPVGFDDGRWAEATASTLRALRSATDHLVLLTDTARPLDDVPACLAAHLDDASVCAVPSDSGLAGSEQMYAHLPARHRAVARAVQTVDVTLVDTQAWTCVDDRCPAVVGDTLVYRDESHLTQFFVLVLAPLLGGALDAVLAGNVTKGEPR